MFQVIRVRLDFSERHFPQDHQKIESYPNYFHYSSSELKTTHHILSDGLPDSERARAIHAVSRACTAINSYLAGVFVLKPPASIYCIDSVPSEVQLGDLSYFIFRSRTSNRHSSAAFESAFADSSSRVWSAQPERGAAIRALRKTSAANLALMGDPNSSHTCPRNRGQITLSPNAQ